MRRFNLLCLLFLVCLVSCAFVDVEAKSRDKNKEKYKKFKSEGSPKEGKQKYSKNSEEYSRKYKKQIEENLEPINQEEEQPEIVEKQEPVQKSNKLKKEKKPYTISVELLEEPDLANDNKISTEEEAEFGSRKEVKQKATKRQAYQNTKKPQLPKTISEDTADFIVQVPKKKKGTRQVLVFQVPAEDEQNEEGASENAVQQYVTEEQDAVVEEDCSCEENTLEEKSSNMCYY